MTERHRREKPVSWGGGGAGLKTKQSFTSIIYFNVHKFTKDEIIADVISLRLPCPTRGRRPLNYIDCIARDIGHEIADMQTRMSDRDIWRGIVYSISDASAK